MIYIEEIKIIKACHKENPGLLEFMEKIIQMSNEIFGKEDEEKFSSSFYKANITLTPKADKTFQEKDYTNHYCS